MSVATTKVIPQTLGGFRKDIKPANPVREAIRIVQTVFKESLGPNGLTSTEIFQLATRKRPPPHFSPIYIPLAPTIPPPPKPDHPVRSLRFLKSKVLPILEGNHVIQMKHILRTSPPLAATTSTSTASASAKEEKQESTAGRKIWAWMGVDPDTIPRRMKPEGPRQNVGTAVGIGMDWTHLNSRRKRRRAIKVTDDYKKMKVLLEKHGRKILA